MRTAPARGICRWSKDAANGNRCLVINEVLYEVVEIESGYELLRMDERNDRVIRYTVTPLNNDYWTCTCPDAKYKRGGHSCKHAMGLRAGLRALPF